MIHDVRRKERQIGDEEIRQILLNNEYGVLSTIGEDGYPYGVPLTYIYEDGKLYFHCGVEGHKLENIRFHDKVSFCVVGKTELLPGQFSTRYESVIAFGKIEELEGQDKKDGLVKLIRILCPDFIEKGMKVIDEEFDRTRVFCFNIEHMTGKARK